jgi:hypothetical protein
MLLYLPSTEILMPVHGAGAPQHVGGTAAQAVAGNGVLPAQQQWASALQQIITAASSSNSCTFRYIAASHLCLQTAVQTFAGHLHSMSTTTRHT